MCSRGIRRGMPPASVTAIAARSSNSSLQVSRTRAPRNAPARRLSPYRQTSPTISRPAASADAVPTASASPASVVRMTRSASLPASRTTAAGVSGERPSFWRVREISPAIRRAMKKTIGSAARAAASNGSTPPPAPRGVRAQNPRDTPRRVSRSPVPVVAAVRLLTPGRTA